MILAVSGAVLVEAHVQDPVQTVLDAPVRAHCRREANGVQRGRGQIEAAFRGGVPVSYHMYGS